MCGLQSGISGVGNESALWRGLQLWHLCFWRGLISECEREEVDLGGYFWSGRPVRRDSAASSFLPLRETSTVFSYSSRRR